MKKRVIPIVLLMMFVLSITANAADSNNLRLSKITPSLYFEGTTAYCEVSIISASKDINATMSLWNGNTLVKSWSGEETGVLYLSGNCSVSQGVNYTLKVDGTIGGKSFTGAPVSSQCR